MDKVITIDLSREMDIEFPTKPALFMQFWKEKLDLVPEEYRGTTDIYLLADEFSLIFTVSYTRPETADEKRVRLKCVISREKSSTDRDLAEYNRLKEKLGV
jgi:hypothetical protein